MVRNRVVLSRTMPCEGGGGMKISLGGGNDGTIYLFCIYSRGSFLCHGRHFSLLRSKENRPFLSLEVRNVNILHARCIVIETWFCRKWVRHIVSERDTASFNGISNLRCILEGLGLETKSTFLSRRCILTVAVQDLLASETPRFTVMYARVRVYTDYMHLLLHSLYGVHSYSINLQ